MLLIWLCGFSGLWDIKCQPVLGSFVCGCCCVRSQPSLLVALHISVWHNNKMCNSFILTATKKNRFKKSASLPCSNLWSQKLEWLEMKQMETTLDYGCWYRKERSTAKVTFQGEQCFFDLKSSAENSISLTDTFLMFWFTSMPMVWVERRMIG